MIDYNRFKKGSEWRKWDLHFHTPSSYDYANKTVTNEEIVETLVSNNIALVAVTDHHFIDVARIKELQKLGEGRICILPGIEFLADARGNDPIHFIGIFSEDCNIQHVWEQLKIKTAINRIEGEGKAINEVYCDLEETIALIKSLGGVVTIHAGKKSNSLENITHSLPHGTAQKEDIAKIVDIFELGKESDVEQYKNIVLKHLEKTISKRHPLIICSDNHNIRDYKVKQNLWVKADPCFEGLKQILYEPDSRVAVHANVPEDKAGYQVIDRVDVYDSHIYNSSIELNPNLNSIIGGRSTGKSILLAAIAKKLNTEKPVKFEHNEGYDSFISEISNNLKIFWKDGQEEDNREIEYFRQGYMYELARDEKKLSKLIQDILKQKGKDSILNSYSRSVNENKKKISDLVDEYYQVVKDINEKAYKASEKGDKAGVESEILRLSEELKKLNITTIQAEENTKYNSVKASIEENKQTISTYQSDIQNIGLIKETQLIKSNIAYELTSISKESRDTIETIFNNLKLAVEKKWKEKLDEVINSIKESENKLSESVKQATEDVIYQKVLKAYSESTQLSEYEEKIKIQKDKLFELNTLQEEIDKLIKQRDSLKESIKEAHKAYFIKINELVPKLSDSKDKLEIKAKVKFNQTLYQEILYSSLNQQGTLNQGISAFKYTNNDDYESHLFSLFDQLVVNSLTLKSGYTNETLTNRILSECFYYLNYDIEYEGDDFMKMSDGKKAFVVLKLLLDFSDKNCPILIDQPEDDLDNRAIYLELVQYIKKKKILRQIIVATHNPNIVVGADSELVIVANQNGHKNSNRDGKKFQYIGGSLEHTCNRNEEIDEILESQGVREHVCEVLEGGNIAFKLREKKYSIKK